MDISQQVLVRLPRGPRTDGRTSVTPVHSFNAGRKRKRNELCAAIDGESINIYDVRNARLQASYPVPPTSTFASGPCSVCLRDRDTGLQSRRRTYIITNQPGPHIQCFSHPLNSSQDYDTEITPIPEGFLVEDIVYFDAVPSVAQTSIPPSDPDILIVNKQGQALICRSDLSSDVTQVDLSISVGDSVAITAIYCYAGGQAVPGPLKHRPDLLGTAGEGDVILTALVGPQSPTGEDAHELYVHTWLLSSDNHLQNGSLRRKVQLLSTSTLHLPAHWPIPDSKSCCFDRTGDSLIFWDRQSLLRYDLTGSFPQLVTKLTSADGDISNAFELPANVIAMSTSTDTSLYDMKYGSLQASIRHEKTPNNLGFITYCAQPRRIICIRSHSLLAINVDAIQSIGRHARAHPHALLSESIGKGVASHPEISESIPPSKKMKIGSLQQNPIRYEAAQSQLAGSAEVQRDDPSTHDASTAVSTTIAQNLASSAYRGPGTRIDAGIDEALHRAIVRQATENDNEILKIEAVSEKQIHIWIRDGHFVRHRLSRKGRQSGASFSDLPAPGKLATALMRFDPTLATLEEYISLCVQCDHEEFAATLKILLRNLIFRTEFAKRTPLIEHADAGNDVEMNEDGSSDRNQALITEDEAAKLESAKDDAILSIAGETLRARLVYALGKLARFSHRTISLLLRTSFSSDEVLALIQLLRQDLYESGYSHLTQNDQSMRLLQGENAVTAPLSALPVRCLGIEEVTKILSTSIEALGIVGLTVQGDSTQFIERMIPELRSEIGRALKTLDDLLALQNTLCENVRYAESFRTTTAQSQGNNSSTRDQQPVQKTGSIVTIYKELAGDHGEVEAPAGILPLSLKADEVSLFKRQQNGNAAGRRSQRELRLLRSRKIPQYSVDRLVL